MGAICVVGLGRVGLLAAEMLRTAGFDVRGVDRAVPEDTSVPCTALDVSDASRLADELRNADGVVSCLPYTEIHKVPDVSAALGLHYFDLTEDLTVSSRIRSTLPGRDTVIATQCGLAPGLVSIVGGHLANSFDTVRSLELKVGALPWYATTPSGYSVTWSAQGLVNEYIQPCDVIRGSRRRTVPALSGMESIEIDGVAFEACLTSGGLGTLWESFEGRIERLDYKTLRYPGHFAFVRFLLDDLELRHKPEVAAEALVRACPPIDEDVVYLHAAATGTRDGASTASEYGRAWRPIDFCGRPWRAISWTTAAALCAVAELVRKGAVEPGFLYQESIRLEAFSDTLGGWLLAKHGRSTTGGPADRASVGAPEGCLTGEGMVR